jgi:aspartate aminotransferase-like enzyme
LLPNVSLKAHSYLVSGYGGHKLIVLPFRNLVTVQQIRQKLVLLAGSGDTFTSVLMQGSGTFCVEAALTTAVPSTGKLLVLANGAYGRRCRIDHECHDGDECTPPDLDRLEGSLQDDPQITHVAVVHCETTTGMLNPVEAVGRMVKAHGKCFIVDAMSSFGAIPMDAETIGADYLVSSANTCIQGLPGFGFVIARRLVLEQTRGQARSLSLDLYDQCTGRRGSVNVRHSDGAQRLNLKRSHLGVVGMVLFLSALFVPERLKTHMELH